MTTLSKTRSILTVSSVSAHSVQFASYDEEAGGLERLVQLSKYDWDDLGRPKEITLTIEPGDKLDEAF